PAERSALSRAHRRTGHHRVPDRRHGPARLGAHAAGAPRLVQYPQSKTDQPSQPARRAVRRRVMLRCRVFMMMPISFRNAWAAAVAALVLLGPVVAMAQPPDVAMPAQDAVH